MTSFIIAPRPSEPSGRDRISHLSLAQMVQDVLTTMLELPHESFQGSPETIAPNQLMAAVRISGSWQATLQIYAPEKLARHIACAMFAQAADVLDDEDVLDAFGEVVNVIGGNVKGMIDQDCTLSLPCVGAAQPDPTPTSLTIRYDVCGTLLTVELIQA
ncbi:chemotaxis protein CheX [Stieleria sp. ICT_E10.1]|uniref:chemotaxis protein CheX n=1 Tax=Stieleria sedimenti TaxID=2976331 RepID=UPI00217FF2D2|nr:chemotaxis protein CheX [Stieleria sedimenti]MCS7466017.1 chemotaxis protein CheX [Stieleria sedimenti]